MKFFHLLFISLLLSTAVSAQQFLTREGSLSFDAGSPLEDIMAETKSATAVYDAATGKIGVQVLMTSFNFKRALMQEHFNENYVESVKYPKASFKGFYTDGFAQGELTMHGVTKSVQVPAVLAETKDGMEFKTTFKVNLSEYDVSIPKTVSNKIDPYATITVFCVMKKRP